MSKKDLATELKDLEERTGDLKSFMESDDFYRAGEEEQHRLRRQAAAMGSYATALRERIAALAPKKTTEKKHGE